MTFGLRGRAVLVTGAGRGFGRIVARRLAAEGCAVALCARDDGMLATTAGEIADEYGIRVFARTCDVTVPDDLASFTDAAATALGGLDGLVANAGGAFGGGLMDSTPDDWSRTFELNVGHAVHTIRSCVPHMRARGGGAAVIVVSISGWKPCRNTQYGAAKAAQIYIASTLARELAKDRIRVNAVSPGSMLIPGGGWDEFRRRDPGGYARFLDEFPGGALPSGEDVAEVVAFLLSAHARAINGANIPVDAAQNAPAASGY